MRELACSTALHGKSYHHSHACQAGRAADKSQNRPCRPSPGVFLRKGPSEEPRTAVVPARRLGRLDWHVSRLFDINTNEERFDLTEPFVRNAGQVKGPLKVKSDFTACIIPC